MKQNTFESVGWADRYTVSEGGRKVDLSPLTLEKWRTRSHAVSQVSQAKKKGTLIPVPCQECGIAKTQAHHDDYSKPLAVRWLCLACHRLWHRSHTPKF